MSRPRATYICWPDLTPVPPRGDCPRLRLHTPAPDGYLAWHEWAEKKGRRHYQVRCPGCGLLTVWKRKPLDQQVTSK